MSLSTIAAPKPFLAAEWRYLALLNFIIEPSILAPFVPQGTELDFLEGKTFVSVVGFLFLNTRVLGVGFPLHRDFEEVNMRFYVRRKFADTWRRGVVFVRELVPRVAIATVARVFYGEPYLAVPMRHVITNDETGVTVEYGWRRAKQWEEIKMSAAAGLPQSVPVGSHEEFIIEHYWGYTAGKGSANTRSTIRAGESGRLMQRLSRPTSPRFTVRTLLKRWQHRRSHSSLRKVRRCRCFARPVIRFFCIRLLAGTGSRSSRRGDRLTNKKVPDTGTSTTSSLRNLFVGSQ